MKIIRKNSPKKSIKKIAHPAGDRMMLLKQKILSDPKNSSKKSYTFNFWTHLTHSKLNIFSKGHHKNDRLIEIWRLSFLKIYRKIKSEFTISSQTSTQLSFCVFSHVLPVKMRPSRANTHLPAWTPDFIGSHFTTTNQKPHPGVTWITCHFKMKNNAIPLVDW